MKAFSVNAHRWSRENPGRLSSHRSREIVFLGQSSSREMQKSNNLLTSIWGMTTQHKTFKAAVFADVSYFFLVEWIVGGKVLHTGTVVGVSEVQEDCREWWMDGENLQWKLECHRVGCCRVSWELLVACSPAVSVCPPYPERGPPPLSEPLPWRWCRSGHTWWSSLLLRKSVEEREKGENVCVSTSHHVFVNFNVSSSTCQSLRFMFQLPQPCIIWTEHHFLYW